VERHQRIDRRAIGHLFIRLIAIEPFAHPVIAEIFDQHPPGGGLFGKDSGRAHRVFAQPAGNMQERRRVFVRRRRVHQHR